jgi:hypothetical protein
LSELNWIFRIFLIIFKPIDAAIERGPQFRPMVRYNRLVVLPDEVSLSEAK